jgi:hypothetical protein
MPLATPAMIHGAERLAHPPIAGSFRLGSPDRRTHGISNLSFDASAYNRAGREACSRSRAAVRAVAGCVADDASRGRATPDFSMQLRARRDGRSGPRTIGRCARSTRMPEERRLNAGACDRCGVALVWGRRCAAARGVQQWPMRPVRLGEVPLYRADRADIRGVRRGVAWKRSSP